MAGWKSILLQALAAPSHQSDLPLSAWLAGGDANRLFGTAGEVEGIWHELL